MKFKYLIAILLITCCIIHIQAAENNENEKKPNYYELLGVSQDSEETEIKKAFRKLARTYHPDKLKDVDEETKKASEKRFAEIANAYEILIDPKTREDYDYELKHGKPKQGDPFRHSSGFKGHSNFDSFFKSFFDNDDDFFKMDDDIFGNMGMGGFKFGGGFGAGGGSRSSFSSSSFGFGGGASMQSVQTSTIFENGKQKTVTKKTTRNSDGTQTVEETISDGVETKSKQYLIGTDNQKIEIGDGKQTNNQNKINNNNNNKQQKKQKQGQYRRQNQHIFGDEDHDIHMGMGGFNIGDMFQDLFQ